MSRLKIYKVVNRQRMRRRDRPHVRRVVARRSLRARSRACCPVQRQGRHALLALPITQARPKPGWLRNRTALPTGCIQRRVTVLPVYCTSRFGFALFRIRRRFSIPRGTKKAELVRAEVLWHARLGRRAGGGANVNFTARTALRGIRPIYIWTNQRTKKVITSKKRPLHSSLSQ